MIVIAALSATITVVFSVTRVDLAGFSPDGHVAFETGAVFVSLLIAFIAGGRFFQTGSVSDLLLACALAVLGIANLIFSVVPLAAEAGVTHWSTWAPLAGRLLGTFGFAAAAVAADASLRNRRQAIGRATAVSAGAVVLIGVLFAVFAPKLPVGIDPDLSPTSHGHPLVVGNGTLLTLQLVGAVFFAFAAVGFYARANRTADRLMGWMAIACVLATFGNVNLFLFPSLYSHYLYIGDYFRIAFYLVLLGGAVSEIQRYQRGLTRTAALEERRRLARELHDGLAQELAFIATQTRWLSRRLGEEKTVDQLVVAAERALDESRSAISALTRPIDEPLDTALAQAAEEVASRVGVRLRLDLVEGIEVAPGTRETLVRIVREAVSNTARHGHASVVTIELSNSDGVALRVGDDGVGFDPAARDGGGFGLTSMRERARALGAEFRVSSSPGQGTEIEVLLP
jgi:signal transduction histidine kinase